MSKLNFTFCAVPVELLKREDLSSNDKLLYSILAGFKANGDCWASNDYLASAMGVSVKTIQRSLDYLEQLKLIKRDTQQINRAIRKRSIQVVSLDEGQNDLRESITRVKMTPVEGQNDLRSEGQNDPLIDNSLINKLREREETLSHSLKLLNLGEEIAIGSGRLKIANSEFLALTYPEAEMAEKLLKAAKFDNPSQVELVLITASAIAEGSESRKAAHKSFLYIKSAIDDLLKTRKLKQDLENSESRTTNSNQLKNNNGYNNLQQLPNRKLVKATIKEQPSLETIELVKDLTAKLCG